METRENLKMLTKRRKEILDFIIDFKKKYDQTPTIREICKHLGLKSTNGVYEHLKKLERDGYIKLYGRKARNIFLNYGSEGYFPIIGEVPAGLPVYPLMEEGEYIDIPLKLDKGFFLKVKGDSMINAGIQNGDMVFVEIDKEITNASIVVALIDGEVTLKRIFFVEDFIELRPENDNYSSLKVDKRYVKILGKVTTLIRKL